VSSLDRHAKRRNDSIVRRHANTALASSASLLGELREGTRGGYEGAIPALKLAQMDRGNRSFAESGSMRHPCIKGMRSTGTHGLLGHFCKEIGKLLHRRKLDIVTFCGSYKKECGGCRSELLCERTELSLRKVCLSRRPIVIDFPQRLGSESGKREPIVELVFLEVSECDEKEPC